MIYKDSIKNFKMELQLRNLGIVRPFGEQYICCSGAFNATADGGQCDRRRIKCSTAAYVLFALSKFLQPRYKKGTRNFEKFLLNNIHGTTLKLLQAELGTVTD